MNILTGGKFPVEDGRSLATEETGYGTHQFGFTDDFAPNGVHVYRLHLW